MTAIKPTATNNTTAFLLALANILILKMKGQQGKNISGLF
jgi:hypothetical protein